MNQEDKTVILSAALKIFKVYILVRSEVNFSLITYVLLRKPAFLSEINQQVRPNSQDVSKVVYYLKMFNAVID